jgi:hypothetical protein
MARRRPAAAFRPGREGGDGISFVRLLSVVGEEERGVEDRVVKPPVKKE